MKNLGKYYHLVPKDLKGNIAFRKKMLAFGRESKENAAALKKMCEEDILFFINVFGWLYEPRGKFRGKRPFITWPFQDEVILKIIDCVDRTDLGIEKCRDMGVSWIGCYTFMWLWLTQPMTALLLVSADESKVDSTGDPDSLFWKIDFSLKGLPKWLTPKFHRTSMHLENCENGSVIDGTATKADLGRAGRRTVVWLDEFATFEKKEAGMGAAVIGSTNAVTESRIFCSTHKGIDTEFYRRIQGISEGMMEGELIRLRWWQHPVHAKGLTETNGQKTSPWFERECKRYAHKSIIAQELLCDPIGAAFQFFDSEVLSRREAATCEPTWQGEPSVFHDGADIVRFSPSDKGKLKFYQSFNPDTPLTTGDYVLAADIAMGTGASNSTLALFNKRTGEQVASYASPFIRPEPFADFAVGLAKWFNEAQMIWDAGGPGTNFRDRVVEVGYRNLTYMRKTEKIFRERTDKPGWYFTKSHKNTAFRTLLDALDTGRITVRDREAFKEMREYMMTPDESIVHASERSELDPSGAKSNHGDRVISIALAALEIDTDASVAVAKEENEEVKKGSIGWRMEQRRMEEEVESDCYF